MTLAYDVDITGRSQCEVAVAFSEFVEEARSIGLAENERKTKCLLSSTAKDSGKGESIKIDGCNFEFVKDPSLQHKYR